MPSTCVVGSHTMEAKQTAFAARALVGFSSWTRLERESCIPRPDHNGQWRGGGASAPTLVNAVGLPFYKSIARISIYTWIN